MAGLIRKEDIDEVRARTDIREIIEGYVSLKSAGIGTFKGLCPFHDERTPSFNVRPQVGSYHCFGCGESGDVYSFVMAMEHTSFVETVERLAARIGYTLHYEGGKPGDRYEAGMRRRLLDAHKIAAEFFERNLYSADAQKAQRFLGARGFDPAATRKFGVGYAPRGWDHLLKHLRSQGFTDEELKATGMFSEGNRGLYDRFRGRIIWPIRTIAGETIGFGARRLFDDDQGPKYLNTPETQLYKKSQVLYGIDLAKRDMTKTKQVVIVEGYTDVMAAHLAGITTAVATCGTAFGPGHIKMVRRMITDDGSGGEIIFTFDGDAAGQKAAMAAFQEDQRFVAQTFVAVAENGMDPCDLRLHKGDAAVRSLIASRRPLFEFAIDSTLAKYDLATLEGRVLAMRAIAPIIAGIKDRDLRPAYMRKVSGQLGLELDEIQRAVAYAQNHPKLSRTQQAEAVAAPRYERLNEGPQGVSGTPGYGGAQGYVGAPGYAGAQGAVHADAPYDPAYDAPPPEDHAAPSAYAGQNAAAHPPSSIQPAAPQPEVTAPAVEEFLTPDPRDPVARLEKAALEIALQHPELISVEQWRNLATVQFRYRTHREVAAGIIHAATVMAPTPGIEWINCVRSGAVEGVHPAIAELAVSPLPVSSAERLPGFVTGALNALFEQQIARQKSDLMMRLEQLSANPDDEEFEAVQRQLLELEMRRRQLTAQRG
ncbi:DNA primase [Rothia sp. HMSC071B01]|uniref:DNA primase n=1 Tax=unclassified Rothia (in: high G+C Gram-positive bacteria) TaxID=2689056 RepID=UPI0008A365F1|nr:MULTISPECIES: DNA primase [unclassified Rothia (in: high G+C Gram-positive bacteria)]OFN72210.1 DNA primase [Rothia sp. HMSC071B01]OFN72700.1 DNA primase [Rothia sp. HMSC078H08]